MRCSFIFKSVNLQYLTGILLVNAATFFWSTNMVLGRLVRDSAGPLTISAFRFILASLIFWLMLRRQPEAQPKIGKDGWLLAGMACSGVILFSPVLYWGLHYTTAVNATIINGLGPLLTGLFAALLVKEPMTRRQITGAVIGFAGIVFLISGGSPEALQNTQVNSGDFIILVSVALWGLYSVLVGRVLKHRSSLSATTLSTLMGLPVLCLLAYWELETAPLVLDFKVITILAYLGIVPGAMGFYAWNLGISRLGPARAMVFYNTLPLYGALLGTLFLGEPIGLSHLIGGILIVGGTLWAARR